MSAMTPAPKDHPLMVEWEKYKASEDYANSKKWAAHEQHVEGSLWAAYMHGFLEAARRAAALHESVNPASGAERVHSTPGADAMGAVIEYRDLIRERLSFGA